MEKKVLKLIIATVVIVGSNIAFVNYKFNELKESKGTKEIKEEKKTSKKK